MNTHTWIHTYGQAVVHIQAHTHIHTQADIHKYTCMRAFIYKYSQGYRHT